MSMPEKSLMPTEPMVNKVSLKGIRNSNSLSILGIIVLFSLGLTAVSKDFLTATNLFVVAQAFSITALVGLAQMVVLGSGGMNLSVGAIGGLVGIVTGGLMDSLGLPIILSILIGVIVGSLCGLLNGLIITRMGATSVSSFLATLATSSVFLGLNMGITNAQPFYNIPASYTFLGNGKIIGIPMIMIITLIIAALLGFVFKYTGLGRQILALGGNLKCAELSGILVQRTVLITHVISAVLASVAAILLVARLTSAQPDIGNDWMLFSFAAPLIGGTRLMGGKVSVSGTVLGALLLALISNGLVHLNLDIYWMTFIQGMIILAAVSIDRIRVVREERSQRKQRQEREAA
ncbi:ABC transporter permease [Ammoniphilus resinae]|uniref:Ribose transport system permease protein n=1 Tax=Ammoniphilus resinae TaxID=861532 RepID=A0ABS4GSR4_9BACL|nr:ABC transporter permease [Ammoniphilus resinae]MBP1933308.1 ribose transport system permease protein [Ammoniphilus resinae]